MKMVLERLAAVLALGLIAAGALGAEPAAVTWAPAVGPLDIAVVKDHLLHDPARGKELPIRITYPRAPGTYPLIVFSHGAGGSGDRQTTLPEHWASHGYVVIQPTHADSIALRRRRGERVSALGLVRDAVSKPEGWVNRPKDVSLVIDSLDAIEAKFPELKDRIDRTRIGVGGHSFRAFTAQAVGGATLRLPDREQPLRLRDDRVSAVLLLSGQGIGQMGLHEDSWRDFRIPMMSITGSLDRGAKGQDPSWRMDPFKLSPPDDKYHLFFEGAHHGSFTGGAAGYEVLRRELIRETLKERAGDRLTDPEIDDRVEKLRQAARRGEGDQTAILDCVKTATLAFWDASLRRSAPAKTFLESDALQESPGVRLTLYRR